MTLHAGAVDLVSSRMFLLSMAHLRPNRLRGQLVFPAHHRRSQVLLCLRVIFSSLLST
jgi:hypothetical protein